MIKFKKFIGLVLLGNIILGCSLTNYQATAKTKIEDKTKNQTITSQYISRIKASTDFIKKNAYSAQHGTFYSDVDNNGNVTSHKVYLVSLSRTIYALAYSSTYVPENLELAKQAAQFLKRHLIHYSNDDVYFITEVDLERAPVKSNKTAGSVDVWQQAYGLVGLVELYRQWPDPDLLNTIELMHTAFINRFADVEHGGFFARVDFTTGADLTSKSFQSTIYPVTAYMNNLWAASPTPKKYEKRLAQQIEYAFNHLWNNETNWVNIKLNPDWSACENKQGECFSVAPGHNFQLAWLLMNSQNWPFLTPEQRDKYTQLGRHIVKTTLAKPIWDGEVSNGFFSLFNPSPLSQNKAKQLSNTKTWWQHCEALIALSFYNPNSQELTTLLDFFEHHFIDAINGGEFFNIDHHNQPITTDAKSSLGKSAYHTVEMYRFLIEND